MVDPAMKWVACFACCCLIAEPFHARQTGGQLGKIKRLYVEPFAVKAESGTLRKDVVARLRKLNSISLVSTKSGADAILSGDGEIWVKGYRSLNPRSGRLPSNGTPVYGGFLSVELKDPRGETIWSYLVTPGTGSENISKDLAKRVVKHLSEALAQNSAIPTGPHR